VSVTAAHASTQQVLQSHAGAIVADLRHAALPVSRLTIEHQTASGGSFGSSTSRGDRQAPSGDGSQRESLSSLAEGDEPSAAPARPGRVRIVL
jgi:hypothetical protein